MKKTIETLKPTIFEIYDRLHGHPEISWQEHHTTSFLADYLRKSGCEVTTFPDCTGVVGTIGNGKSDLSVGLRADMDALWQEVDGKFQANHSCGHDAHMTMVLGVLLVLQAQKIEVPGRIMFLFQPAEEQGNGALKMIEKKVVDELDFLYGVHVRPMDEVPHNQAAAGILHGANQTIFGSITGYDAHGARPHQGNNAIEVISTIVEQLKGIHLDPTTPYSIKMTQVTAGEKNTNIIPGSAKFHLDLRAQTNEAMNELVHKTGHVLQSVARLYQTSIHYESSNQVYAATINKTAQKLMEYAITQTLGEENLMAPIVTPGAEDFHYYTRERPHLKATMLGLGCDLQPGLHHPNMTFNREALLNGIEILTRTVLHTFDK
jgi:amidohydrolase